MPATPDNEVDLATLHLRQAFRQSNLTYAELAKRTGGSTANVWQSLNVSKRLRQSNLDRIAAVLSVMCG
jgi:hypothetical protein